MKRESWNRIALRKYEIMVAIIIIIKIIMMGFFSSDYQNKLFMPFVGFFVAEGENPYNIFYNKGFHNAFPYPVVMLLTVSIGQSLISIFNISNLFLQNILFKLPNLFMDIIIFKVLITMYPGKKNYSAILYFASPIILYATYMHGQLDLIPTGFLFLSIYYITFSKSKYRFLQSVIFLSMALLSKLHIVAALPVIFLYLIKKDGIKRGFLYFFFLFLFSFVGVSVFYSDSFVKMVFLNSEQSVLTKVQFDFNTVILYIPIIAVVLIYLTTFSIKSINKNLFISLLGVLFAVFLALCPPMPGWYVWIIPFITIFFIQVNENKYNNIFVYMLLNVLYLLYFGVFHMRKYVDLYFLDYSMAWIKNSNIILKNISFTLLSGVLLYIIYSMYQLGIASNSLYKRKNLPFTITIAGDSGSGKTTLIKIVERILGRQNLLFIEGDGDHKWERGEDYWDEYTHLNPKANYLYRQAENIEQLRLGIPIKRVEYDHDLGRFGREYKIKPNRYILLCGLHSLYLPQMRRNSDLKIYMDVDETLRRYWKIKRDIQNRGYSKTKILEQIEKRVIDAQKYIIPQRNYADIVIQYFDKNLTDCFAQDYVVELDLKLTVSSDINVEPIVAELSKYDIKIIYDYSEDLKKQILIFDECNISNKAIPFYEIANKIVPQLDEITNYYMGDNNKVNGIVGLFILLLISYKMRENG